MTCVVVVCTLNKSVGVTSDVGGTKIEGFVNETFEVDLKELFAVPDIHVLLNTNVSQIKKTVYTFKVALNVTDAT